MGLELLNSCETEIEIILHDRFFGGDTINVTIKNCSWGAIRALAKDIKLLHKKESGIIQDHPVGSAYVKMLYELQKELAKEIDKINNKSNL